MSPKIYVVKLLHKPTWEHLSKNFFKNVYQHLETKFLQTYLKKVFLRNFKDLNLRKKYEGDSYKIPSKCQS
jgi:hypothetical protein